MTPASGRVAFLALVLLGAAALAAVPAGGAGPLMQVTAYPLREIGTPGPDAEGQANYSGEVDLLSDPVGSATINVEITSQLGWNIAPPTFTWRTTTSGKFLFNFTVGVPSDAIAQTSDTIVVLARYRIGTATVASEQTNVYAEAGPYYGGTAGRLTPAQTMSPGKSYPIEFDIRNTGNSPAVYSFTWADPDLNSRLKADFRKPDTLSIAGFNNTTAVFLVTPQATTPGGKYSVPVRMDITDRTQRIFATVNFTIEMEFDNLPIYQGIFPRIDLTGPYTLVSFVGLFLTLWLAFQIFVALLNARRLDQVDGPRFTRAFAAKVRRSGLVRLVGRVVKGRGPRQRPPTLLRPEEIRARRTARVGRDEK